MFMLTGDFTEDLDGIFKSLYEVCRNDPLFPAQWKKEACHDSGWGYVFTDNDVIDFKRYRRPVYDCPVPEIGSGGKLIVHVRKAASGEPVGLLDSHPHHRGDNEYDVYLVHNGSYNKSNIASRLNEGKLENQPDSEFFLEYLMAQEGDIEQRIRTTLEDTDKFEFVKTSNNIFILAVDKTTKNTRLFYYSYSKLNDEYVTLYRIENERVRGVVSSSLLKSSSFPGNMKISKVPQRILVELT